MNGPRFPGDRPPPGGPPWTGGVPLPGSPPPYGQGPHPTQTGQHPAHSGSFPAYTGSFPNTGGLPLGAQGLQGPQGQQTADVGLSAAVDRLLSRAAAQATPEAAEQLGELRARLGGPLRLAIAGKIKAGKSTLLNALVGEELAPTDAGECTKVVTWYSHGHQPTVVLHPRDSAPEPTTFRRSNGALDIDLRGRGAEELERIEVFWPTRRLAGLTLIDTPGISSLSTDVSARTLQMLTPDDDRPSQVDAVLYLLRHTHASDMRFLESFVDDEFARGSPMNTVGVLSRSDEIGSCRLDAMTVAARIATRYTTDPRLRRLCPVVVPVAGLLGYAGTTLRESEFQSLALIARSPDVAALLLTADRFGTRPSRVDVSDSERQHLLARLGLFGVRLSVELIRSGEVTSATELAKLLTANSGLDRLRSVLLRQFTERARVLQARTALAGLGAVLRTTDHPDAPDLRATSEQISSAAHEFEEVRLLDALRSDELELRPQLAEELDRVLGGSGHDPASRLGLDLTAEPGEIGDAARAALDRWRAVAEHPLLGRAAQTAARGATRTLEGIVTRYSVPVPPR